MKTKLLKSLLTIACLLCSIGIQAHDFEVDGVYFNITNETEKTVEVTYEGIFYYVFRSPKQPKTTRNNQT